MDKFKPFILIAASILILIGGSLYIWDKHLDREPGRALSTLPTNVDMHLRGVNYSEVKEGRKEWTLKADALRYFKSEQRLLFDKVTMAFFNLNDKEINVSSDEAEYDRSEKMVRLRGNIRAESIAGYQLAAEEMVYNVTSRQIIIEGPFKLVGPRLTLNGSGLSIDINTRHLIILVDAQMIFKAV